MSGTGFFDLNRVRRFLANRKPDDQPASGIFDDLEHCDPNNPFFSDVFAPPIFEVEGVLNPEVFQRLLAEVSRPMRKDRIEVRWFDLASVYAGMAVRGDCEIGVGFHGDLHFCEPEFVNDKFKDGFRWKIVANRRASIASRFVTLAHELAHIYCGHLGGSFDGYSWLDRRSLSSAMQEFEAAIVSYHVASLAGLRSKADIESKEAYSRARAQGQRIDKSSSTTCRLALRRIAVEAGIAQLNWR